MARPTKTLADYGLSPAEEFFVKNNLHMTDTEIGKAIGRTAKEVVRIRRETTVILEREAAEKVEKETKAAEIRLATENPMQSTQKVKREAPMDNLIARDKDKRYGYAVYTPAASEYADESKKFYKKSFRSDCIQKIDQIPVIPTEGPVSNGNP